MGQSEAKVISRLTKYGEQGPGPRDVLGQLDSLKPVDEGMIPASLAEDIMFESAKVGLEDIHEMRKSRLDQQTERERLNPTFAKLLDEGSNNFLQRAARIWIKPRNPERTIKLLKAMQVDHFQQIPIKLVDFMTRRKKVYHTSNNYNMANNSLNAMIDFATNKTTLNELIHLYGMGQAALFMYQDMHNGYSAESIIINGAFFLLNSYCVLAQRYTRARLSIAIDKALARNKNFDISKYRLKFQNVCPN